MQEETFLVILLLDTVLLKGPQEASYAMPVPHSWMKQTLSNLSNAQLTCS